MTTTYTDTFNRNDIVRVFASFAADYRIVAEFTGLHSAEYVATTIKEIAWLAEEHYLKEIHLQHKSATGTIRTAAVYRVSTDASNWSSDRPGSLYWSAYQGDSLAIVVYYSQKWWDLSQTVRDSLSKTYLPGWTTSSFSGNYGSMSASADKTYSSRAYGMKRTTYTT